MTMTPPDAQGPDDLGEDLSDAERELLPDGDRDATDDTVDPGQAVQVDEDNVPHPPPGEDIG
jgi:hypothetical protein